MQFVKHLYTGYFQSYYRISLERCRVSTFPVEIKLYEIIQFLESFLEIISIFITVQNDYLGNLSDYLGKKLILR